MLKLEVTFTLSTKKCQGLKEFFVTAYTICIIAKSYQPSGNLLAICIAIYLENSILTSKSVCLVT